jgi:hypothetical protein
MHLDCPYSTAPFFRGSWGWFPTAADTTHYYPAPTYAFILNHSASLWMQGGFQVLCAAWQHSNGDGVDFKHSQNLGYRAKHLEPQ